MNMRPSQSKSLLLQVVPVTHMCWEPLSLPPEMARCMSFLCLPSCDGNLAVACLTPPWELDAAEAFAAVVDQSSADNIYNGLKGGHHWSPTLGSTFGNSCARERTLQ